MSAFTATFAGFWVLAEAAILIALALLNARITAQGRPLPLWLAITAGASGFLLIARASSLFAHLGTPPFGRRLAWNLLCMVWVLLEWGILAEIVRLNSAAARRYLGREIRAIGDRALLAGIALIVAATAAWHHRMIALSDSGEILIRAYAFVRLAGTAYVAIEIAIAFALHRSWRIAREVIPRI